MTDLSNAAAQPAAPKSRFDSEKLKPYGTDALAHIGRVYDSISKNIERENNLIGLRVNWAILLSIGTFAGQTLFYAHLKDSLRGQLTALEVSLGLSTLAIAFCAFSAWGVWAAQSQMEVVKKAYWDEEQKFRELGFPQPFGSWGTHLIGNGNAVIFPIVLMIVWAICAGKQYEAMTRVHLQINAEKFMTPPVEPFNQAPLN